MKKDPEFCSIEDFLLDDNFMQMAKRNNPTEIDMMRIAYPDKVELMDDALLLQKIEIHTLGVDNKLVDQDYKLLQSALKKKKRRQILKKMSVVAIITIICLSYHLVDTNVTSNADNTTYLMTLLQSGDINVNEVQIISGKWHTYVNENDTICQSQDGTAGIVFDNKIKMNDLKEKYVQLIVPNGKRSFLKLSDGTFVWVNSGSKILYPKSFEGNTRDLFVDGEIYIEVAKIDNMPFVIHTNQFEVKVLGTKFNINAYANDAEKSVVLVEGKVEIVSQNKKGILHPSQGFFMGDQSSIIKMVDTYNYTCWRDNIMKFTGEPLANILKSLARYYNIEIRLDKKYQNEIYKGKLDLNNSIDDVLYNISLSSTYNTITKRENIIYLE